MTSLSTQLSQLILRGINAPVTTQSAAIGFLIVALVGMARADAGDEIYRCALADGSVSFQELPCTNASPAEDKTEDAPTEADDDPQDVDNPFDSADADEPEARDAPPSANRSECERETRGRIDAIFSALESRPPKARAAELLDEAMQLTRQLRACKQL